MIAYAGSALLGLLLLPIGAVLALVALGKVCSAGARRRESHRVRNTR